jgi:hypothetical protein
MVAVRRLLFTPRAKLSSPEESSGHVVDPQQPYEEKNRGMTEERGDMKNRGTRRDMRSVVTSISIVVGTQQVA